MATAELTERGEIVSTCCNAPVEVSRMVRDIAQYGPVRLVPADGGDHPKATLTVRYERIGDSLDSGDWVVTCNRCTGWLTDIDIEEDGS